MFYTYIKSGKSLSSESITGTDEFIEDFNNKIKNDTHNRLVFQKYLHANIPSTEQKNALNIFDFFRSLYFKNVRDPQEKNSQIYHIKISNKKV